MRKKMENNMVTKAQEIISSIKTNQKYNADKLSNLDKQVKDLNEAVRGVQETAAKPVIIEGKEIGLKQYINADGKLQLTTTKKSVNVPGYGNINVTTKGLLDTDENHSQWHAELKEICQTRSMAKMICKNTPKTDAKLINHLQKAPHFMREIVNKSLYDTAGQGGEWVPDEFRETMYQEYMTPRTLADEFSTVEVQRPTVLIPRMNYGGRPFIRGSASSDNVDANAFNASTPQSAQASITITGIATRYRVDTDLIEDQAVQMVPLLTKQIGADLTDAYEDCLINGDTRNFAASQDTGRNNWNIRSRWGGGTFADGSDHRQIFNGLRYWCHPARKNTEIDLAGAALTAAKVLELISKTGEMAAAQGLVLITSPEYFIKEFMGLSEVKTVDTFGPAATILTGQLGSIYGVPIVLSRFMGIDLNASGFYDNVTKTKSGLLCVNRSSWMNYQKSGIQIETAKEIASGALEIVSTMRKVLASPDQDSATNVAYLYNTAAI